MTPTEFYRRVTALALYDHLESEVSTGFFLNKVLQRDLKESRETVAFVRETVRRYFLVDGQLLEKVGEKDWYLYTADRQQYLHEAFWSKLTPERVAAISEAQHKLELRQIEKSV